MRACLSVEQLESRLVPTVPVLNSLPGAQFTTFLDFDGHTQPSFGGRVVPAFDFEGGAGTVTAAEQEAIRRIWEEAAEDFSPFNINVTTVEPVSQAYNVRVVFGGTNSGWCSCSGLALQTIVPGTSEGLALVFSGMFGSATASLANLALHEGGHAWGMGLHQSLWFGMTPGVSCGTRVEYYSGPGDYLSPNLGGGTGATIGIWWYNQLADVGVGCTGGVVTHRDEMALLEMGGPHGSAGLVGYRPDDHGDAWTSPSLLVDLGGGVFGQAGILAQPGDSDWFRLDVPAGGAMVAAAPKPFASQFKLPNTDLYGVLTDSNGTVLAEGDDPNSLGVSVALPQGTYYLGLISPAYGRQGQFQVALQVLGRGVAPGTGPAELAQALPGKGRRG